MSIIGYEDIAGFIKANYARGSRIVEVGIGQHPEVATLLKGDFELTCTDTFESGPGGLHYVKDDVFKPNPVIYAGASLIYSIRPPVDMQAPMASIARDVGADLLIRPFSSERADLRRYLRNFRCINHNSAVFYLYDNSPGPSVHPPGP